MSSSETEFDGIFFTPGDDDSELQISFWRFKDEEYVNGTPIGNMYHVAFFKRDVNGDPALDDSFEAVFTCPKTYIERLAGAKVYGCIVRKTDKSSKWFEDYLQNAMKSVTLKKLINTAKSILETK